ncbi:MAG: alpha/beta fold hydrolase [Kofleriaceae bacterium]
MKRIAVTALVSLLACGGGGRRVSAPVMLEDEPAVAPAPTVPGGVAVTYLAADGATIAATYWAPDRPSPGCAVFVHQLSSTRAEWTPVVAGLRGHGHLLAIDLRGHGASTRGADGPLAWKAFATADWERVTDDVAAAIADLGARGAGPRCVVVGASIGSSAVLRLAGAAPERVAAVVLLSPGLNYRGLATPDAARATRAPVLIVHSQEAGAVDAATALANILREGQVEVEVVADPGTAHGMRIVAADPALVAKVVDFIGAHL